MDLNFTSPVVTIRPTLPADRQDVFDFCKYIWDGHDYIPYVFDEWLADPRGQLFSAVYSGHAVGLARIVNQAPGQWWLEGFRVDPRHQGLKIGSKLHRYMVAWWQEHGDGTVRLWTNVERVKVHHLCEQDGFIRTMERIPYNAPPLAPTETIELTLLAESDLPAAVEFALRPEHRPHERGMLDVWWQAATPNETSLRWLIEHSQARLYWWRGRMGLICTWEAEEEGQVFSMIGLAAADEEEIPEMLNAVRSHPLQRGYDLISWRAPLIPRLDASLKAAGFTPDDGDHVYQYEKRLD